MLYLLEIVTVYIYIRSLKIQNLGDLDADNEKSVFGLDIR